MRHGVTAGSLSTMHLRPGKSPPATSSTEADRALRLPHNGEFTPQDNSPNTASVLVIAVDRRLRIRRFERLLEQANLTSDTRDKSVEHLDVVHWFFDDLLVSPRAQESGRSIVRNRWPGEGHRRASCVGSGASLADAISALDTSHWVAGTNLLTEYSACCRSPLRKSSGSAAFVR
jgi:hypothetical protein